MALDAVLLSALVSELAGTMPGARIDRVQQPARDAVLLSLYTREGPKKLVISAAGAGARLHYTRGKYENPDKPPMFCMLLRKHLTGARIDSVTQPEWERMVVLSLTGRDELGVECARSLVVELMGRASNVILCDEDMRIIDCMRRVDFGEEAYRRLLPGMLYKYPQRPAKPCFFALEAQERRRLLEVMPREKEPSAALLVTTTSLPARPTLCKVARSPILPSCLPPLISRFCPALLAVVCLCCCVCVDSPLRRYARCGDGDNDNDKSNTCYYHWKNKD